MVILFDFLIKDCFKNNVSIIFVDAGIMLGQKCSVTYSYHCFSFIYCSISVWSVFEVKATRCHKLKKKNNNNNIFICFVWPASQCIFSKACISHNLAKVAAHVQCHRNILILVHLKEIYDHLYPVANHCNLPYTSQRKSK